MSYVAGLNGSVRADRPRAGVRVLADAHGFAEIDEDVDDAVGAQDVGDAVGDIALGDAVERHRHARGREADTIGGDGHLAIVDQRPRGVDVGLGGTCLITRELREMPRVEPPQRLHGDVEGAVGERREARGLAEQAHHVGARIIENAIAVRMLNALSSRCRLNSPSRRSISAAHSANSRCASVPSGCARLIRAGAPSAMPCHSCSWAARAARPAAPGWRQRRRRHRRSPTHGGG